LKLRKSNRKPAGQRRPRRSARRFSQMITFGLGGMLLVIAVAFGGRYMGDNAAARGVPQGQWADIVSPSSTIMRKSSLLGTANIARAGLLAAPRVQTVSVAAKGNFLLDQSLITGRTDRLARLQNLITSPPMWQLEKNWKLGQDRKRKVFAARRNRLAQSECMSRAIYFEARSESELGQLAVAKVIMNRVESKKYPNSICKVIYQGAERRNACQFSFACDGKSDKPRYGKAWRQAKRVAKRSMAGGNELSVIATALFYHADYVKPKWASAMERLIKIGNHIFYRGS